MQLEKSGVYALVALIVIVIVALGMYAFKQDVERMFSQPKVVEIGDCVEVNYIARYASNGTVFDTSYEEIAKENGIYSENISYEPLKIFVDPDGTRELPEGYESFSSLPPLGMKEGFIKYLVGMREGENKTVILPPDEAYGDWNTSLAESLGWDRLDRNMMINCTEKVNKSQFSMFFPNVSIEKNVTFDASQTFSNEEGIINATIIDVDDRNVTIRYFPRNGTTFTLPIFNFSATIIYANGSSNFTIHLDPKINQTFTISLFWQHVHCKVVGLNETNIKLALNTYAPNISLIGQPVEIFLSIEKIYKTSKES